MVSQIQTKRFEKKDSVHIVSAILLFVAFSIVFFFTMDAYYAYAAQKDTLASALAEKESKTSLLSSLNTLKTEAADPKNKGDIDRYAGVYHEDEFLSVLLASSTDITVSSVSLDKGERLPSGLSKANFTVAFQAMNENALEQLLDTLTSASSRKRFQIKGISFPFDSSKVSTSAIPVSLQLGSYYLAR